MGTRHNININPGTIYVEFIDEPVDEILAKVTDSVLKEIDKFVQPPYAKIYLQTFYGTFIKGGLQTFGCNYNICISMDEVKYDVHVDTFNEETGSRDTLKQYERLFHQPLSEYEMDLVVNTFGETILNHIDYNIKQRGLRK